jgi:hypothetical protein
MAVKRRLVALGVVAAAVFAGAIPSVTAAKASHLSGGGTASISQVAFNVTIGPSGSASGSFECLMAGRSAFVLGAFGLAHNMIVHATPTSGTVSGSVVRFSDDHARLSLDGNTRMNVHVQVWVDAATQTFQLTVLEVGAMPVETFLSGGVHLS